MGPRSGFAVAEAPPLVELRGVSKGYPPPTGRQILRHVDLTLGPSDFVALVGPSGCGKSTLLQLIGLLGRPDDGQVRLDGHDCSAMSDTELSRHRAADIGFVFQSFHLREHRSCAANVAQALVWRRTDRAGRAAAVDDALALVEMGGRGAQKASSLSGGEQQRVAIARALVTCPRVLLADEPTGNLDKATGEHIMDLLAQRTATGTAVVVVTHDMAVASRAQRVLTLRDCTLVEA